MGHLKLTVDFSGESCEKRLFIPTFCNNREGIDREFSSAKVVRIGRGVSQELGKKFDRTGLDRPITTRTCESILSFLNRCDQAS